MRHIVWQRLPRKLNFIRDNRTRGVMVGADESQEWMLPWWWHNYSKHNDLPVMFVDFGMSKSMHQTCRTWGSVKVFDDFGLQFVYPWFKKPFAILQSAFYTTLWLDADCEVRSNIEPLFDASAALAVHPDRCGGDHLRRSLLPGEAYVNSGVVRSTTGNRTIVDWAKLSYGMQKYARGDQEALCRAIQLHSAKPHLYPSDQVRLRLEGDGPCLVMHWTGPHGKDEIRKQGTERSNEVASCYDDDAGMSEVL